MINPVNDEVDKLDQALEQMLGRADPRPTPSSEGTKRAKQTVRKEWEAVSRRRITRRRLVMLATAATVALGFTLAWQSWWVPDSLPVQVASIEKSIGTLFVAGDDASLETAGDLQILHTKQVIVTDIGSRVALAWGTGGSLRVDENTRLTLNSENSVYLDRGRIYFDSVTDNGEPAELTIKTRHGDLIHIGTQYMTEVTDDTLVVSVREGSVSVKGNYHQRTTDAGTQVRLTGRNVPETLNIGTYGAMWQWIEHVTPGPISHGKNLRDLIEWISRETGRDYRFENAAVEIAVDEGDASGDLSQNPSAALEQLLRINNLSYRLDPNNGDIIISQSGR